MNACNTCAKEHADYGLCADCKGGSEWRPKLTSADRVAALRKRREDAGLVRREVWVHPDDWGKVQALARALELDRGAGKADAFTHQDGASAPQ